MPYSEKDIASFEKYIEGELVKAKREAKKNPSQENLDAVAHLKGILKDPQLYLATVKARLTIIVITRGTS